jgi:hypothetical protein
MLGVMMTRSLLRKVAIVGVTVALFLNAPGPVGSAQQSAGRLIIVDGSPHELMDGYHSWMVRHKEVLDSLRTGSAKASINPNSSSSSVASGDHPITLSPQPQDDADSSPLLVRTPSIDLYSPSGISVLHSTDPASNAQIIRSIADHRITAGKVPLKELRPTLREAIQMFSKLGPFGNQVNGYVLFAITCAEARCDSQREAINQLHAMPVLKGVSVVEVNLH